LKQLFLKGGQLLFMDQGKSGKLLVDNFPNIQIIATGSSAIDLSNEIVEPLTGRKSEFQLFPFSLEELLYKYSNLILWICE
jgi:predicted AAA+ superfamily ATPase